MRMWKASLPALGHVLVASNAASLQSLGGHLLELIGHKVSREREVVDRRLLAAQIVDADLRIRHTTAVARLDVRLVLLVAVALGRPAAHCLSLATLPMSAPPC